MKESYRKGVANHPGLEPCKGGCETALEALDRGICRLGIELRKCQSGNKPTVSLQPEGNKVACASASASQPCGVIRIIQYIAILIHCTPEIMETSVDFEKHLIQAPLVARPRRPAAQPVGISLAELAPFSDRFIA